MAGWNGINHLQQLQPNTTDMEMVVLDILNKTELTAFSAISSATGLELLTAIYGLVSVIVLVANKYYGKWIASVKREAATIQQFFDVVLFSAAVGNSELEWGNCPSRIDIAKHIGDYTDQERADVKNWYSDYSRLSGSQQVFYCQSENERWTKNIIIDYMVLQILIVF